jgi:hypothetical protein
MNVVQNILYPFLSVPTRCSVSSTGRPQVREVGRAAPAGIDSRSTRSSKMGILWSRRLLKTMQMQYPDSCQFVFLCLNRVPALL